MSTSKAAHAQIPLLHVLLAETTHLDRHRFGQFAREIIDVHTRAAVNVRRIFVREEERLHVRMRLAHVSASATSSDRTVRSIRDGA